MKTFYTVFLIVIACNINAFGTEKPPKKVVGSTKKKELKVDFGTFGIKSVVTYKKQASPLLKEIIFLI